MRKIYKITNNTKKGEHKPILTKHLKNMKIVGESELLWENSRRIILVQSL